MTAYGFQDVVYPGPERRLVSGGIEVCVVEAGEGPPILLLPPAGRSLAHHAPLFPALAAAGRVVGIDLPGWGKSAKPDLPYGVDWYLDWLEAFLDDLAIERPILLGSSMGGLLAVRLARRRPVRALALVSPAGGPRRPLRSLAMRLLVRERRFLRLTEASFRRQLRAFFHGDVPAAGAIAREGALIARSPEWPAYVRAFVRGARTVIGTSILEDLASIDVPALVLWGREDRVLPAADATAMHRVLAAGRCPDARLELIPGCGHYPPLEKPEEVARILGEWLASLGT